MANSFKYGEQLHGRDIRLIKLETVGEDEQIRCSLATAQLDCGPEYNALSYTWGDTTQRRQILCDGALCTVTKSLYQALAHIRLKYAATPLWADALCVNQKDDAEKTRQVRMMVC
jgi:Heterokaryon incompatibility protein (HET)